MPRSAAFTLGLHCLPIFVSVGGGGGGGKGGGGAPD